MRVIVGKSGTGTGTYPAIFPRIKHDILPHHATILLTTAPFIKNTLRNQS